MEFTRYDSSEGNVFKYVFTGEDFVAEAVLYKYESFYKRTVICCSVQSGCPVGCTFCGTGKNFIRNLFAGEIVEQVQTVLKDMDIENINSRAERFQIMFMSMGEPMLNWQNVENAIYELNDIYPNAELLISTVGIRNIETQKNIIALSSAIDKVGLQFSVHRSLDVPRRQLIPYRNLLTLNELRDWGTMWYKYTNRPVYLNYCIDGTNNTYDDYERLVMRFSAVPFYFTFSVVCSADETMKDAGFRNLCAIETFRNKFVEAGYNTRVFNPAGQDDIGGGCGQLWYVQDWMKQHRRNKYE